jgi:hypothetical protein
VKAGFPLVSNFDSEGGRRAETWGWEKKVGKGGRRMNRGGEGKKGGCWSMEGEAATRWWGCNARV